MYKKYYGFKERPFKLVPNPAYLFLSRSHEEALGHLYYAVQQGEGFVEITGEVGTGKTTLCRMFLEKLDENTEAAFIFNPKLDAIQLLKAINDEFGIRSDADNSKTLIDSLNAFLLEKRSEGKKVILLIDEAQNLSMEVLEQLRLLSNLETTFDKLLQIILVGQPELGDKLDSHELRQLGQRITLSCHLTPLTFRETREYIRHRIRIASHKPGVNFSRSAFYTIYKYANGIPRLINIVCDRALLTGFSLEKKKINKHLVRSAIKELSGRRGHKSGAMWQDKRVVTFLVVLCLVLFGVIFFPPRTSDMADMFGILNKDRESVTSPVRTQPVLQDPSPLLVAEINSIPALQRTDEKNEPPSPGSPSVVSDPAPVPLTSAVQSSAPDIEKTPIRNTQEPAVESTLTLRELLNSLDRKTSRSLAVTSVLDRWQAGLNPKQFLIDVDSDTLFFNQAAKQGGLNVSQVDATLDLIKALNLPVLLKLTLPEDPSPKYAAVRRITDDHVVLIVGRHTKAMTYDELPVYWTGGTHVVWKNFFNYAGTIPLNAPNDSILTLKIHLREIGFDTIDISSDYDEDTLFTIMTIQKKHGLPVDGIVGPLTKIALYNEMETLSIPRIVTASPVVQKTEENSSDEPADEINSH